MENSVFNAVNLAKLILLRPREDDFTDLIILAKGLIELNELFKEQRETITKLQSHR